MRDYGWSNGILLFFLFVCMSGSKHQFMSRFKVYPGLDPDIFERQAESVGKQEPRIYLFWPEASPIDFSPPYVFWMVHNNSFPSSRRHGVFSEYELTYGTMPVCNGKYTTYIYFFIYEYLRERSRDFNHIIRHD